MFGNKLPDERLQSLAEPYHPVERLRDEASVVGAEIFALAEKFGDDAVSRVVVRFRKLGEFNNMANEGGESHPDRSHVDDGGLHLII